MVWRRLNIKNSGPVGLFQKRRAALIGNLYGGGSYIQLMLFPCGLVLLELTER